MGIRYEKGLKNKQCLWCGDKATLEYKGWAFCSEECKGKWKKLKGGKK